MTNSLLSSWIVIVFLLIIGILIKSQLKNRPGGLQNLLELVIEGGLSVVDSVTGHAKQTQKFFAVVMTIFLFVLINNWSELIPGFGSFGLITPSISSGQTIGTETYPKEGSSPSRGDAKSALVNEVRDSTTDGESRELTPLFRSGSADLSFTVTLALIAVIMTQWHGISALGGWGYFKRFFNFKNPLMFFVGLLELLSEFAKLISFSFRLFGNIFAGEVLLIVVISLVPFIAPIPFYAFEVFVGFIQAFVFAMLTLVFFKLATTESH